MSAGPRILVLEPEAWAAGAAARTAQVLAAALESRGRATWALSGGGTPRPVYERLAADAGLDWSRIEVFFADERAVPPDHADSSFRMVRESLTGPLGDRAPRVHRMEADHPDLDAAAGRYAALLPERLDLALLGMGPDGHTASLFPDRPGDWERDESVLVVLDSPKPPAERLTLSASVLSGAREQIVFARGADKAARVAEALDPATDPILCPAALAASGLWILDPESATAVSADPRGSA